MTQPYARTTESLRKTMIDAKAGADALGRSVGAVARASQTIGIAWVDDLKQFGAEAAATAEKVAKSGSPAGAVAIQGAFVKASGERMMARAATVRALHATLVLEMVKPFAALGGRTSG